MSRVTEQYRQACRYLAGGVSSSTRLNQALGHAMIVGRAEGCRVWDLDDNEYYDLCCSHGATLLGHGDVRVRRAVEGVLERGAACSYETEQHAELARLLCETIPCLERVRFTGSGTEATMHCIRLARAFTGRKKLLKFEGHFHGYHDQVMFSIGGSELGDEMLPAKPPGSTGMSPGIENSLVVAPFNQPDIVEDIIHACGDQLAAVILEPVYYNAGCVLPEPGFHELLRRLTSDCGALLIFDEVLSAFRMAPGGAQEHYGITPDLCTVGKAVGGGYPLSVFGGRADIMARLMPEGDCQHSGTYNGHPVVVAAALAAVQAYREPGFYEHIDALAGRLYPALGDIFRDHDVPGSIQGLGACFGIYFGCEGEVRSYRDTLAHDREMMFRFIAAAARHGVYFHDYGGAACHHGFCAATTLADVDEIVDRLDAAVSDLARGG